MMKPDPKPVYAEPLHGNGFKTVREKLLKHFLPSDETIDDAHDGTPLDSAIKLLRHLEIEVEKNVCLTPERQDAVAKGIIAIVEQGEEDHPEALHTLTVMINFCRAECFECINNTNCSNSSANKQNIL